MIGLGLDLCEVRRMEGFLQNEQFLLRYFTQEERDYLTKRNKAQAQSAAAMFAAKEAFLKATGDGLGAIPLHDIGVHHAQSGAPSYALTGKAADRLRELGGTRTHLSLTHESGVAGAVCIIE